MPLLIHHLSQIGILEFQFSGMSKLSCISIKAYSSLIQGHVSFEGSICAFQIQTSPEWPPAEANCSKTSPFCCKYRKPQCFSWHSGSGRRFKSAQGYNQYVKLAVASSQLTSNCLCLHRHALKQLDSSFPLALEQAPWICIWVLAHTSHNIYADNRHI